MSHPQADPKEKHMSERMDRFRRYLVPVAPLPLPDQPDTTHWSVTWWDARQRMWMTGTALCGYSTTQGALPAGALVTCPQCQQREPAYRRFLDPEAGCGDPRYDTIHWAILGFCWPTGDPVTENVWTRALATRIIAALRTSEVSDL